MAVQHVLCQTWSKIPKSFVMTWYISKLYVAELPPFGKELLICCRIRVLHPTNVGGPGGHVVNTSDSEYRGRWFEPHSGCRVLSLSKTYLPPRLLVIPRKQWLHPNMTEKIVYRDVKHQTKPNQKIPPTAKVIRSLRLKCHPKEKPRIKPMTSGLQGE